MAKPLEGENHLGKLYSYWLLVRPMCHSHGRTLFLHKFQKWGTCAEYLLVRCLNVALHMRFFRNQIPFTVCPSESSMSSVCVKVKSLSLEGTLVSYYLSDNQSMAII